MEEGQDRSSGERFGGQNLRYEGKAGGQGEGLISYFLVHLTQFFHSTSYINMKFVTNSESDVARLCFDEWHHLSAMAAVNWALTDFVHRPCYQRGNPCQRPAGNRTTRRPPDHRKETQTAVVWTCLSFIRSGKNHLARYSERGKKTRQTEEEVGRQHREMDRPGVHQVPEGSGEQRKTEETGCEIIYGAPTTLAGKE